jgi:hypothetical protein
VLVRLTATNRDEGAIIYRIAHFIQLVMRRLSTTCRSSIAFVPLSKCPVKVIDAYGGYRVDGNFVTV